MGKNAAIIITAVSAAMLFSSCGGKKEAAASGQGADEKKIYTLKTWSMVNCEGTRFFVAEKMGFFTEAGLKIIYTGETQPPQRIASIINGNNDIGLGHPNLIAIAREGGAPIRGVMRSIIEPPDSIDDINLQHMWWISNKNGPYQSWEDVKAASDKGKKVKIQMGQINSCSDFLTNIIVDKYKLNKKNILYITMPDAEGVLSLKNNLVDIIVPHPPYFNASKETGVANILMTSRNVAGKYSGTSLIFFSDKFINDPANKEAIKRFVKAIKKAERYANDNMEQASEWTAEALGVPVQANHYYARNAVIDDDEIQFWIDGSIKSGALPADTKLKVSDVITHEFDQYGNEEDAI